MSGPQPSASPTGFAPTDRRPTAEIVAVLLAAGIHFAATKWLAVAGLDIAVIGGAFVTYAAVRLRRAEVRAAWGVQRRGLAACARAALAWFVRGVFAMAAVGWARGTLVLDLHLLPLLLLYPLWGFVQQVLVLGLVAANLDRLGVARGIVLASAALGFAAVHLPDWPLCAATAMLGLLNAALFFRHRNVWPLALLHGWLGALFYRWVLARDPWAELLAALQ